MSESGTASTLDVGFDDRSRQQRFVTALLRAADTVRRHYAAVLACWDLTNAQYNVLRILRRAGPRGLPTLTIRARMVERAPAITRLVDQLVERGWVERQRDADDRRVVYCRLTDGGRALLRELDEPVTEAGDALDQALTEKVQRDLTEALSGLAEVLDPEAEDG